MTKKMGAKKGIIITITTILLVLSAMFAVLYHNYTKEIRVMEPVEHMEQQEGVSMDNILLEIGYSVITEGEFRYNYLYVFENGEVYSGYCINYHYVHDPENKEQGERNTYHRHMDDRYWNYLYEQKYWGRLSSCDLDGIINELAQVDDFDYYYYEEVIPEPMSAGQTGRTYNQENSDIYEGHLYKARMVWNETECLDWVSRGDDEEITMYLYDEHAHNAIDIIKSTWAYGQWTNQIFGEGWEERIDLKDVW